MTESKQENSSNPTLGSKLISIGTDLVTIFLTASLLALPIEDGNFWPVAFIAFVPLLLRVWTRSYWSIFILTYFSFFLYFYFCLQWVEVYARVWRILISFMNALTYAAVFVLAFYILRKYRHHFFATVLACLIVLLDFKQTIGFMGFPWPIICHSQYANLPLIQISAITGCWGVTFLIVLVNEALAHLIAGKFRTNILAIAILPVILIGIFGLYGAISLAGSLPEPDIQATVVQWERATNVEWTVDYNRLAIDGYTEITIDELTPDPAREHLVDESEMKRLVIWPETAIPDAVINQYTMNRIRTLASSYNATFVVGCTTFDPAESEPIDMENAWQQRDQYDVYNSLVAFEPDNTVIPMYSKVHLVPFGEVIPMKSLVTDWFPEYPWGSSDISPGTGFHVVDTQVGKIGSVICFESFFPQFARIPVKNGAEILVLGSNTSWFGMTNASSHHARFDTFRAVENRIWFCRAATTGISSFIDPQGHTVASTDMFVGDAITVPISRRTTTTFYTRYGDWLPALCGLWVLVLLMGVFVVREGE